MTPSEPLRTLREEEARQTLAEYGVVLSVITILVIATLTTLGFQVSTVISNVTVLIP